MRSGLDAGPMPALDDIFQEAAQICRGLRLYRRICDYLQSRMKFTLGSVYKEVRVHIRADDLDTVACPTIDNMLKEQYAAVWQSLLVLSPRTCPSKGASMCIHKA